jgi:predicted kinase
MIEKSLPTIPERRVLPRHKALILIMGVAGSGKSTLAKAILERIVCVYLDNNFIADAFYPDTRLDPDYVRLRPHFYSILYRITEENLLVGNTVLLDVPHIRDVQDPKWCESIISLAIRNAARLIPIRCLCDENVLKARLKARGEPRDLWKLNNWNKFIHREPVNVPIPFDHLDIFTDNSESQSEGRALDYLLSQIN